MSGNFHEQFSESATSLPSERSTGLVFAVVCALIAGFWVQNTVVFLFAGIAALFFVIVSLLWPRCLRPLNVAWMALARILSKIVNPIVMLILFVVLIVPAGLVMRLRYDPLKRKIGRSGNSYWVHCKRETNTSMINQF